MSILNRQMCILSKEFKTCVCLSGYVVYKPQSNVADWDTGNRHHLELPRIYAFLQKQTWNAYLQWEKSVDLCSDWANTKSLIGNKGSYKTGPQICGSISPLWLTTAAACLHLGAGGSPVHIISSTWSLTESPSFGSIGLCEIRDSIVRRTRPLTGLRGEERPPNTTISPPGKEVTVWYSLTSAGEKIMCSHNLLTGGGQLCKASHRALQTSAHWRKSSLSSPSEGALVLASFLLCWSPLSEGPV